MQNAYTLVGKTCEIHKKYKTCNTLYNTEIIIETTIKSRQSKIIIKPGGVTM